MQWPTFLRSILPDANSPKVVNKRLEAIALACQVITRLEGWSSTAYQCPAGIWTIGWGRTGSVRPDDVTDKKTELSWLRNRLSRDYDLLPDGTVHQQAAMLSFVYNVGRGAFSQSTLLRCHARGWHSKAEQEFHKWKYANGRVLRGLVRRRQIESRLYAGEVII
jgi:lysozyme